MTFVSGTEILLASITAPHVTMRGTLVSFSGRYAEAALEESSTLSRGALVQFQTDGTLYLGEIESGWTEGDASHIRVLIEHTVDLDRAAAIRHLWNTDNAE